MKSIINDNYASIVARGLITESTSFDDFLNKAYEELNELSLETSGGAGFREELADCIMVLLNMAKHYDIDIIKEIENKIKINYKRAKK